MDCDILVVGAGLCGLHAAGRLEGAGRTVVVAEKSRGLGGRAATRRWDNRPVDHGAQFFTAKTPDFSAQVAEWEKSGLCHEWTRGFHHYVDGVLHPPHAGSHARYACRAGMASLGRALGEPLGNAVWREAKVAVLAVSDGQWQASLEDGRTVRARGLLLTPPPAQSADLLSETIPAAAEAVSRHVSLPCLAVAACFPRRETTWHGIQAPEDGILAWIGHDTGKRPELHPGCTILMLHAAPGFSAEHASAPDDIVIAALLRRASEMTSSDWTSPDGTFIQRWRYALPAPGQTPWTPVALETPAPLVVAGDWCAGGRIEGAWLAGREAADRMLAMDCSA
jgi:hypothetical protein